MMFEDEEEVEVTIMTCSHELHFYSLHIDPFSNCDQGNTNKLKVSDTQG